MSLTLKDQPTFAADFIAAAQAANPALTGTGAGSILGALANASAATNAYNQFLALLVLQATRLATSSGTDVDSWVADYGLSRIAGQSATGQATLSRYVASQSAVVLPGVQLKSADLSQTFQVAQDTSNSLWNAAQAAYVVPSGTLSITVPVEALAPGSAGNISAGSLTVLSSSIPGIDLATNASAFANGSDAETDAALKARWTAYINTRSEGTLSSVAYAINSVQQNLSFQIVEGQPGYFSIYLDDGTGSPGASLITRVGSAVNAVRPVSVSFGVLPASVVPASVSLSTVLQPGYDRTTVNAAAALAIGLYVDSVGVGNPLPLFQLSGIIQAVEGVQYIERLTINGLHQDLIVSATQSIHLLACVVA